MCLSLKEVTMTPKTIRYEVEHFDTGDIIDVLHNTAVTIRQSGLYQIVKHDGVITQIWLLRDDEQTLDYKPKYTVSYVTQKNTQHVLWYAALDDAQKTFDVLSKDKEIHQIALCMIKQLVVT